MNEQDLINGLINLKKYIVKDKDHIKKYNRIRKIHDEIVNNMYIYINEKDNDFTKLYTCLKKEGFDLKLYNPLDMSVFIELTVYKVCPELTSVTEKYITKNKFRSKEKVEILNAMNNSVVGLFKIVDIDSDNCYVTYEEVFTHKKYKIIDISCATINNFNYQKQNIYIYNRLITYDGITFGTGIHLNVDSSNNKLCDFINNHDYINSSDLYRCMYLYDLFREGK